MHERVGESVATTQQVVAESIISSSSKKICVSGSSLKEALRAEVIPRAHQRIIPSQMSIDAALSKKIVQADLRVANNARLTTDLSCTSLMSKTGIFSKKCLAVDMS